MNPLRVVFCTLLFGFALVLGVSVTIGIRSLRSLDPPIVSETTIPDCIAPQEELTTTATAAEEIPDLEPDVAYIDEMSPYAIQGFIEMNPAFAASRLWERLGISEESLKRNGVPFLSNCSGCTAQLDVTNVGDFRDTVLLRIENRGTEECRYLLFAGDRKGSYRLIDFIDHGFGRYEMPTHRWVESGGRTFLVVRVQTASGTGVAMYDDRVFMMRRNKLVELLEYPGEGHDFMSACMAPGTEFFGKVREITGGGDAVTIQIALDIRRVNCEQFDNKDFGWKKRLLTYRWSAQSGRAVLDKKASTISGRELGVLSNRYR